MVVVLVILLVEVVEVVLVGKGGERLKVGRNMMMEFEL